MLPLVVAFPLASTGMRPRQTAKKNCGKFPSNEKSAAKHRGFRTVLTIQRNPDQRKAGTRGPPVRFAHRAIAIKIAMKKPMPKSMGLIKVTLRKINNACEDARLRPKAYKGTSSRRRKGRMRTRLFIFLLFFFNSRMPRHSCCEVRVMQLHDILLLRTSASLHSVSVGAKPLSPRQCAPPPERLSQSEIGLTLGQICCHSPPERGGSLLD